MGIQKKHYIFDLDDTLTDSYEFNQDMFVQVFAPYVDITNDDIDHYLRELHYTSRGTSMYSQFKEAIDHFSLSVDPEELKTANEQLQLKNIKNMHMFDAVEETIKTLKKRGKKVSVFSNRDKKSLMGILKTNRLHSYFTNIVSCVEEGHEKPDPYCLQKLIENSKQPIDQFMYIGDSKTDCQFAKAAGIDFVVIDHYLNDKKFYRMMLQSFM